jgi:hypothetical protein
VKTSPSMSRILIAGMVLVVLSGPVLIPLVYEWLKWSLAKRRYAVEQIHALQARIGDHSLMLEDSVTGLSEQYSPVATLVDGRNFSVPWVVRIRPEFSDANRYWLRATLASWQDLKTGERRLVAIQSNDAQRRKDLRYRLLFVDGNGKVTEESFSYADRAAPGYRVLLASHVSGAPMSFRFGWAYGLPTVWFPLVYPLLTTIIGAMLVCAGLAS